MKLYLLPTFDSKDLGDGGIRRVVEAQKRYLPDYGVEFVDSIQQADIVAIHATDPTVIPVNTPYVLHCHGLYWADYTWPNWADVLNKQVINSMQTADVVTAPSEWVAKAIRQGSWINPIVIGHGVSPEEWGDGTNKHYVLWNKTRIDAICNPEPMNKLAKLARDVSFVSTFGREDANILITGKQPYEAAKNLIKNAGVYLCTARETFGIGTLEAMISGVPVLGFNWGGQVDIVKHLETGYLVTPGDYDSLLEGLRYCIKNRERLGENAKQYILENCTWEKVISKYHQVYSAALDSIDITAPKISVIVPCYNLAQYLPDALDSILTQGYDDFEVIVVNDASPDNTKEVATEYCNIDDRVRLINNPTNQYLSGALNTGITAARGKYIIPLDADNKLGIDALGTLAQALDKTRDIDIVYGSMRLLEPDGKEWISTWPPKEFDFKAQMSHKNQISSTAMYRKSLWQRIGGYKTRCRTAEDADFWCRMTSYGGRAAKVTDDVTLIYRNRADSMSRINKDWAWEKWYPWYNDEKLAPLVAPVQRPSCHTYEPPAISVIIPIGPGHEIYYKDAVDSVLSQTFQRYELILVNDSGTILDWVPPFVKVINTAGGIGVAAARNVGIKAGSAPTFIPLDADDFLHPVALDRMYSIWRTQGGYVYSDWRIYETNEDKTSPDYNCTDILKTYGYPVSALYPKQAWIDVKGYDEALLSWEDWDFVVAITAAGYCGNRIPESLLYYRLTTGNRRLQIQENRKKAREVFDTKWKEYIVGGKQLMACGGCAKGGIARTKEQAAVIANSGYVLIEYLRDDGPITYRGHRTGFSYRFSHNKRVKSVNAKDAEIFLQRPEFRLVKNA
jgi:glycosyltransferase involved in cell wall biosynthesis